MIFVRKKKKIAKILCFRWRGNNDKDTRKKIENETLENNNVSMHTASSAHIEWRSLYAQLWAKYRVSVCVWVCPAACAV